MASQRKTSPRIATKAADLLRSPKTNKQVKAVAASALSQAAPKGKKKK